MIQISLIKQFNFQKRIHFSNVEIREIYLKRSKFCYGSRDALLHPCVSEDGRDFYGYTWFRRPTYSPRESPRGDHVLPNWFYFYGLPFGEHILFFFIPFIYLISLFILCILFTFYLFYLIVFLFPSNHARSQKRREWSNDIFKLKIVLFWNKYKIYWKV